VIIDSGKDQWEADAHGLELDFTDLADDIQTAARELGAAADPGLPRFAQLFLDAADVATVRAFWVAALGYTLDRRAGVSDIHDLQRLNPVLVFQELDSIGVRAAPTAQPYPRRALCAAGPCADAPRHDLRSRRSAPRRVGGSLAGRRSRRQRARDHQRGMMLDRSLEQQNRLGLVLDQVRGGFRCVAGTGFEPVTSGL
jgi:hypothetical protein